MERKGKKREEWMMACGHEGREKGEGGPEAKLHARLHPMPVLLYMHTSSPLINDHMHWRWRSI